MPVGARMDLQARAGTAIPRMLRAAAVLALGAGLGLGLVGCVAATPAPSLSPTVVSTGPSPTGTVPVAAASPTPPAVPTLRPTLDARANLPYFNLVVSGLVASKPAAGGREIVDALVAGGFDKAQMEVTFDETSAALAADSIQVAVRFGGECLIGQNGPATGGYHGAVMPMMATGRCLVGVTRQIDW